VKNPSKYRPTILYAILNVDVYRDRRAAIRVKLGKIGPDLRDHLKIH
jgi:hypothetical protein